MSPSNFKFTVISTLCLLLLFFIKFSLSPNQRQALDKLSQAREDISYSGCLVEDLRCMEATMIPDVHIKSLDGVSKLCTKTISAVQSKVHTSPLQWRHNGHDDVSNHQPHDCLLNRLFRRRSKKTSKLRVLAFARGIHRGFPAQMASNAENVSIWWRHLAWGCFPTLGPLDEFSRSC